MDFFKEKLLFKKAFLLVNLHKNCSLKITKYMQTPFQIEANIRKYVVKFCLKFELHSLFFLLVLKGIKMHQSKL